MMMLVEVQFLMTEHFSSVQPVLGGQPEVAEEF